MINREITISNENYNLLIKIHLQLTEQLGPYPIATLDETLSHILLTYLNDDL